MELRAAVQSLSFKSAFGWCDVRNAEVGRDSPCRVHFPVCVRSVAELTPKELHHKRKKEEWKRLRKARRMEKLAEQAREQAKGQERKQARRREGLCSFEKYKLAKERGGLEVVEWKSGVQGKSTLMSKFEEEFAMRVKEAVSSIKPVTTSDGEDSENSTRFREDSHSVFGGETEDGSDDWLLSYGRRSNDDRNNFERIADDGNIREAPSGSNLSMEDDNSRSIRDDVQRDKGTADRVVVGDARPQHDNLELRSESGTGEVESTFSDQDERVDENSTMNISSRSEYRFIDHSFTDEVPMGRMRASTGMYNNGVGMHRRDEADAGTASDRSSGQEDLGTLYPRDWRVNPKTPRQKDRLVARQIIDRRKGEPLSTLLDANLGDITPGNYGILDALHEDVTSEVWRKPVDEREQLEWLVQELLQAGQKQKFFLSRLMHGARLKWTDGRLLELVKMLGARREWRRAMEVVHWVHCREHFSHCRSRYVCTTLLAVLGKCLRPVEALNVFNVMREEHSTYPDMAAYHSIAVTLGKAGHLTQLLHLIESLREGPVKKDVRGSPRQLNWNGRLEPDIVVYNAVINACGPHRQWEGTEWVLQQLQSSGIRPNSTTYGLAIEVMVKSGQYAKAWKYYEIMERGDFLPNALTFKALVEALGTTGEVDKAIEMVEEMEHRGILENAGVYYALASALCAAGRLSEALVQVDKLLKIPSRKPDVVTFTGLIRTCEKVGRWQDAISLFNRMQYVCAPNVGTYNIMIALYGRHRMFEEARDMFELVKKGKHKNSKFSQSNSRLSPTEHTYESMLGACAACEDWGYFEVVLEEFNTRGFQLDCRRHAWFISPIVKAGQERLIHSMVTRLQRPGEPPSVDLYRVLFPLLSMHGYHILVLNYLNGILQRGVALDTPEWSSIVGNAVDQLPMVDAEQFICTLGTEAKVHDDISVKKLLQCLVSVGAETKARRLVNLLGLEVDEFTPVVDATQGDSRLLPQEEEKISSSVLENKKVERMAEVQELDLNDIPSIHNNATVKAIDDGLQFQVRSQQIQQPQGEKVLCGPRIVRGGFGVEQPSWLIH